MKFLARYAAVSLLRRTPFHGGYMIGFTVVKVAVF
jgi:hypothetical protein